MALNNETNITAGDSSTNNQAQTINNTFNGVSYRDVKEIALDVFKDNFLVFRNEAAEIATARATEIIEKLLERLEDGAIPLDEFATPGMQDSLFSAQKEYAMSGDEEVADMLVEILVQRAQTPEKNRFRIVLDESLKVASKLTIQQMDLLTVSHAMRHMKVLNQTTLNGLYERLDVYLSFFDGIDEGEVDKDLSVLEYLNLGKISVEEYTNPASFFLKAYPAFFNKGFDESECLIPELGNEDILISCLRNNKKLQFQFSEKVDLISFLRSKSITESRINEIASFFDVNIFTPEELISEINGKVNNFSKAMSLHNNTNWKCFQLSPVGKAIAMSNFYRKTNQKLNMSTWID